MRKGGRRRRGRHHRRRGAGFFGDLWDGVKKSIQPAYGIVRKALPFLPGIGSAAGLSRGAVENLSNLSDFSDIAHHFGSGRRHRRRRGGAIVLY